MIKERVLEALTEQTQKEGYSSQLYLAMASYAEASGYPGIAQWLYAQAEEERLHMLKFIAYINERGGHAMIPEIDKPPYEYGSVKEMFEKVMEHEQFISQSINDIVGVCMDERDFTTHSWLQWFVTEQIEEESSVSTLLDKINLVGEHNIYEFDRDIMSTRSTGNA